MTHPATSHLSPRLVLATLCVIALGGFALFFRQEPANREINHVPTPVIPEHTEKTEPSRIRDIDTLWQRYEALSESLEHTANGSEKNGSPAAAASDLDEASMTEQQRERLQRQQDREKREQIRQTARSEIRAALAQIQTDSDIGQVIHILETLNQRLEAAALGQSQRQQLAAAVKMLRRSQEISNLSNRILQATTAEEKPAPDVLKALTEELHQSQQQLLREYSELYKERR